MYSPFICVHRQIHFVWQLHYLILLTLKLLELKRFEYFDRTFLRKLSRNFCVHIFYMEFTNFYYTSTKEWQFLNGIIYSRVSK